MSLVILRLKLLLKNLKKYKSPDTNQIPAEVIQAEGEMLCSETHDP
jgi:hypothetical protein